MKNSVIVALISVTLAFSAFVAGFYLGKNATDATIEISAYATTAPSQNQQTPSPSQPSTDTSQTPSSGTASSVTFPININTATLEELDLIPGIGPVLAQRILDYRDEIGAFLSVEELLDVSGIGEKTLAKMLEYITV